MISVISYLYKTKSRQTHISCHKLLFTQTNFSNQKTDISCWHILAGRGITKENF